MNTPEDTEPIRISIGTAQSAAYHWTQGQKVRLQAWVEHADGRQERIKDAEGKTFWDVILDSRRQGGVSFLPGRNNFSGQLVVLGNKKRLYELGRPFEKSTGPVLEKVYEHRFKDGAKIKLHFTDQILEEHGESEAFAEEVLNAAVLAYRTITQGNSFNSAGFSFASPNEVYASDPDRTLDIYVGDPSDRYPFPSHGTNLLSFKDAPCFDTIKVSDTQYEALILIPAHYKLFIKNWQRLNPSPLGPRNVETDLKGTLIHETLHAILFYYNKNLNKEEVDRNTGRNSAAAKVDWYVEGLARYFETFVGAKHDFFSQGFKQTLPDKIRFSRGGANYYMRYPDQPFTDLRYENALFWRFIDGRFGMRAVESLSREFRTHGQDEFEGVLERTTGMPLPELLEKFALATLLKDFGFASDGVHLKDVAKTQLRYKDGILYLKDGEGAERPLGNSSGTDWIGRWQEAKARFGEPSVAGDSTDKSDVSGLATDFYEIELDASKPELPWLGVFHAKGGKPLAAQIVLVSKKDLLLHLEVGPIPVDGLRGHGLREFCRVQALSAGDIDRIYLLITNTDAKTRSDYQLVVRP